jgi:hypothetical protein
MCCDVMWCDVMCRAQYQWCDVMTRWLPTMNKIPQKSARPRVGLNDMPKREASWPFWKSNRVCGICHRTDWATSTYKLVNSTVLPAVSGCKMVAAGSCKALLFTKIHGVTFERTSPQYSRPWIHQTWNIINSGNFLAAKTPSECAALRGQRVDRQTLHTAHLMNGSFNF